MEKLTGAIGKAPHEVPFPTLMQRLREERDRINRILAAPKKAAAKRTAKTKAKKERKASKTLTMTQLRAIAEATGLTVADLTKKPKI